MRLFTLIASCVLTTQAFAVSEKCPVTPNKELAKDTIIFFYPTIKKNKTYYVPLAKMENGQFASARETLIPSELTIYNLKNDQAVNAKFTNQHDNVDYDLCRSIGNTKQLNKDKTLFASQPLAKHFKFSADASEKKVFTDGNEFITQSDFAPSTQYWYIKQYRYDKGFAMGKIKDAHINEVLEDCALCKD